MFNPLHNYQVFILIKILIIASVLLIIGSIIIGPIIIFYSDIGDTLTWYDAVPLDFLILYILGINGLQFSLGYVFIIFWAIYLAFFLICLLKPISIGKFYRVSDIFSNYRSIIATGKYNLLVITILWFSAYFVISIFIDVIQQLFGITLGDPLVENPLLSYFYLSAAPLNEEIFFRVLLLGIPLYLFFIPFNKNNFLITVYHPSRTISFDKHRLAVCILIAANSIFFGFSHLIFGGGYEIGKITQASLGGLVLGWLYYRYGLASAITFHWISNYVLFSYSLLGFILLGTQWNTESDNIFLIIASLITILVGVYFIALLLVNFFKKFQGINKRM